MSGRRKLHLIFYPQKWKETVLHKKRKKSMYWIISSVWVHIQLRVFFGSIAQDETVFFDFGQSH